MLRKIIVCLLLASNTVWAQTIKLIVPFSPGGQVDIITREAEKVINQDLKRTTIVEYRTGAGASIGIGSVARNRTSEVNLLFIDANALANVIVSDNLSMSDFKFLGLLGSTSTALAVIKGSPFRDLKHWATVKRPIYVGTNGVGSPHHYYAYSLGKNLNLAVEAVPYKGIAPALNDLFNGSIDAMWGSVATLLPYEQAGKIEMVASVSARRLPMAPGIPTFAELGYPNTGASTHWMIVSNSTADADTVHTVSEMFRKLPLTHDIYTKTHILPERGSSETILTQRIQQQREFAEIIRSMKTPNK